MTPLEHRLRQLGIARRRGEAENAAARLRRQRRGAGADQVGKDRQFGRIVGKIFEDDVVGVAPAGRGFGLLRAAQDVAEPFEDDSAGAVDRGEKTAGRRVPLGREIEAERIGGQERPGD